jgi:rhodanese-related sulfurtransferase
MSRAGHTTINDLLEAARRRLDRVAPGQALAAVRQGAVLVDIRSERQRERDGLIPGALSCARNALEWRVDPASGHSDPALGGKFDRHIILVCDEGYQSSLAAATLQDLGFARATDLAGGFRAWRAAGLPVELIRSGTSARQAATGLGASEQTPRNRMRQGDIDVEAGESR